MIKEDLINKGFTNIQLDKTYFDLYIVRKSILDAVKKNIPQFKGTLLDVGCGIMPYKELIQKNNKLVTSYIGLDFNSNFKFSTIIYNFV